MRRQTKRRRRRRRRRRERRRKRGRGEEDEEWHEFESEEEKGSKWLKMAPERGIAIRDVIELTYSWVSIEVWPYMNHKYGSNSINFGVETIG